MENLELHYFRNGFSMLAPKIRIPFPVLVFGILLAFGVGTLFVYCAVTTFGL